jgi:HlyD family secretion protein
VKMASMPVRDQEKFRLRVLIPLVAVMLLSGWWVSAGAQEPRAAVRPDPSRKWDATAPGRVESRSQEVRIGASVAGRITEVRVKPNDKVFPGELMIRIDDDEARARLAGAEAQVALRERARDEERRKGSADRRRAEDDVADAEREVAQAWARLDAVSGPTTSMRTGVDDAALSSARSALTRAQDQLQQRQDALRSVKENAALPTRAEGELNAARADLTLAEAALQKTRIRAPFDGTVLQIRAKAGETVVPSPDQWLVLLADVSTLRVRAELDERDFSKVRVGQKVIVRANAFPDREFEGKVLSIARYVGPGRLSSPGQRNKLTDIDVMEVVIDLTDPGPLAVGMQVDAFFSADGSEQSAVR